MEHAAGCLVVGRGLETLPDRNALGSWAGFYPWLLIPSVSTLYCFLAELSWKTSCLVRRVAIEVEDGRCCVNFDNR